MPQNSDPVHFQKYHDRTAMVLGKAPLIKWQAAPSFTAGYFHIYSSLSIPLIRMDENDNSRIFSG